jgi:hypothetical protein
MIIYPAVSSSSYKCSFLGGVFGASIATFAAPQGPKPQAIAFTVKKIK